MRPTPIPKECLALLGTMSDCELARRFGVSTNNIFFARHRRGIKPRNRYNAPVQWTDSMLMLLGAHEDAKVARMLNLRTKQVASKRRQQGIPSVNGAARERIRWTPEMLKMLGKIGDKEFAEKFGVGHGSVAIKRNALDIASKKSVGKRITWTQEMLRDIRVLRTIEFTKKHGISTGSVNYKRAQLGLPKLARHSPRERRLFTDLMRSLLGKRPDIVLARNFKMSSHTVQRERERLGIPLYIHPRLVWTPEKIALLSTMPGRKLAKRLGLSECILIAKRKALGIKPYGTVPRRIKWTKAMLQKLGTVNDVFFAEEFGLHLESVRHMRAKKGIPMLRQIAVVEWTPAMEALLGKRPDTELGRLWGMNHATVQRRRVRLGIPCFSAT